VCDPGPAELRQLRAGETQQIEEIFPAVDALPGQDVVQLVRSGPKQFAPPPGGAKPVGRTLALSECRAHWLPFPAAAWRLGRNGAPSSRRVSANVERDSADGSTASAQPKHWDVAPGRRVGAGRACGGRSRRSIDVAVLVDDQTSRLGMRCLFCHAYRAPAGISASTAPRIAEIPSGSARQGDGMRSSAGRGQARATGIRWDKSMMG